MSTTTSYEDTPSKVLQAAGEIFAERGFQNGTVRDICALAGVNLASVNYHFRDKETLYQRAVEFAHEQSILRFPLPEWQPNTPPEMKLKGFIRTLISRMIDASQSPWSQKLMLREIIQPTGACRELAQKYFKPHFERLNEIIKELLPENFSEERRHKMAFSIVGQCLHYRVCPEIVSMLISGDERASTFTVDRLADHITEFSLGGIERAKKG
jgi:AcrR family transcriptional regulator